MKRRATCSLIKSVFSRYFKQTESTDRRVSYSTCTCICSTLCGTIPLPLIYILLIPWIVHFFELCFKSLCSVHLAGLADQNISLLTFPHNVFLQDLLVVFIRQQRVKSRVKRQQMLLTSHSRFASQLTNEWKVVERKESGCFSLTCCVRLRENSQRWALLKDVTEQRVYHQWRQHKYQYV